MRGKFSQSSSMGGRYLLLTVTCLSLFFLLGHTQKTCNWTCIDDQWTNVNCWDCQTLPDENTKVFINSTKITILGNYTISALSLTNATLNGQKGQLSITQDTIICSDSVISFDKDRNAFILSGVAAQSKILNQGTIEGSFTLINQTLLNQGSISLGEIIHLDASSLENHNTLHLISTTITGTSTSTLKSYGQLQITSDVMSELAIELHDSHVETSESATFTLKGGLQCHNTTWNMSRESQLSLSGSSSFWDATIHGGNGSNTHFFSTRSTLAPLKTAVMIVGASQMNETTILGSQGVNFKILQRNSGELSIYNGLNLTGQFTANLFGTFLGKIQLGNDSFLSLHSPNIPTFPIFLGSGTVQMTCDDVIDVYSNVDFDENRLIITDSKVLFHLEKSEYSPRLSTTAPVMIYCNNQTSCVEAKLGETTPTSLEEGHLLVSSSLTNLNSSAVHVSNADRKFEVKEESGHVTLVLGTKNWSTVPSVEMSINYTKKSVEFSWKCDSADCAHTNASIFRDGRDMMVEKERDSSVDVFHKKLDPHCTVYDAKINFVWSWYNLTWNGEATTLKWMYIPEPTDPIISVSRDHKGIKWKPTECACPKDLIDMGYIVKHPGGVNVTNTTMFVTDYDRQNISVTAYCVYQNGQRVESDISTDPKENGDTPLLREKGVMTIMYVLIGVSSAIMLLIIAHKVYVNRREAKKKEAAKKDEERQSLLRLHEHSLRLNHRRRVTEDHSLIKSFFLIQLPLCSLDRQRSHLWIFLNKMNKTFHLSPQFLRPRQQKAPTPTTSMRSSLFLSFLCLSSVVASIPTSNAIVNLFQWNWRSIGDECVNFLGPKGFKYVQTSPVQETVQGSSWWVSYQPVSYNVGNNRGTRQEFKDMIDRCHSVGVKVLADVVVNHMSSNMGSGTGTMGSSYSHYQYPAASAAYGSADFHYCGTQTADGANQIDGYGIASHVWTCELNHLADLATETWYVRDRLIKFLTDLQSLGVDGFRVDAAKHIDPADLQVIVKGLAKQPDYFSQEVRYGYNEAVNPTWYLQNGAVQVFSGTSQLKSAFTDASGKGIFNLVNPSWPWGATWGAPTYWDTNSANTFVTNWDLERENNTVIHTTTPNNAYVLSHIFLLAFNYGVPTVYSAYDYSNFNQGPPNGGNVSCYNNGWRCEHRWNAIANMVNFRLSAGDSAVGNFVSNGNHAVAFGRGKRAFVVINNSDKAWTNAFTTALPAGTYCDVIHSNEPSNTKCDGPKIVVNANGQFKATVNARDALAIYVQSSVRIARIFLDFISSVHRSWVQVPLSVQPHCFCG
ncbi:alpha amylase catalytic subunit [Planoprotostelium fungivorum]|uniref:alpha-amylase n=1 Tax=Planoprotostelium fungivorum TaxID=1890364 RepID=A0A2P6NX45_9EUKA|nr:alpha amylase catalytic subunit [Planoprotostelium fungivorum]